jgi:ribonuclease P protein component
VLKKENRISLRRDILEIKEKGEMLPSSLFSLLLLKKESKEKKFGVIISKKISKKAVERNKAKRLIMEGLRRNLSSIEDGNYGLFLVKRSILGRKVDEVEKEIKKVLGL